MRYVLAVALLLGRFAKAYPRRALILFAVLLVLGGALSLYDASVRDRQAALHLPCSDFLVSHNVPCDPSVTMDEWLAATAHP